MADARHFIPPLFLTCFACHQAALSKGVRRNKGPGGQVTAADIIEIRRVTEGERERLESFLGYKVDW